MSGRWRPVLALLAALLVATATGGPPAESAVEAAVRRGLDWILAHPASQQDGGFRDLVDEALFYRVFLRLGAACCPDPRLVGARDRALDRLTAALRRDADRTDAHRSLLDHYHLLLAAYLLNQAGRPIPLRGEIVSRAARALAVRSRALPTVRLAVALLLERLGEIPPLSPRALREAAFIARLTRRGASPVGGSGGRGGALHPFVYYALVHEIALLTDFGAQAPDRWLQARRGALIRLLEGGVRQAVASGSIDRLAELLLAMGILGACSTTTTDHAVHLLLATQHEDGSWGARTPRRANPVRHAVQTATAALMDYARRRLAVERGARSACRPAA